MKFQAVSERWFIPLHKPRKILKEMNIIQRLDGRQMRNSEPFKQVHEKMKEAGLDRSVRQTSGVSSEDAVCLFKVQDS